MHSEEREASSGRKPEEDFHFVSGEAPWDDSIHWEIKPPDNEPEKPDTVFHQGYRGSSSYDNADNNFLGADL